MVSADPGAARDCCAKGDGLRDCWRVSRRRALRARPWPIGYLGVVTGLASSSDTPNSEFVRVASRTAGEMHTLPLEIHHIQDCRT